MDIVCANTTGMDINAKNIQDIVTYSAITVLVLQTAIVKVALLTHRKMQKTIVSVRMDGLELTAVSLITYVRLYVILKQDAMDPQRSTAMSVLKMLSETATRLANVRRAGMSQTVVSGMVYALRAARCATDLPPANALSA